MRRPAHTRSLTGCVQCLVWLMMDQGRHSNDRDVRDTNTGYLGTAETCSGFPTAFAP